MLKSLNIKNFVLIDSLDIEFPEGLVIVTGQTGAGKSIMLGALSLLSGAKADAGMIGENADNCVVEAEFEIPAADMRIKEIMEQNDVEWDNGQLIIRRVVNSSGRSRSFINDCPVSLQLLSSISSLLIDIHSQHQSLLLTDRNFQLSILDHFAGSADTAGECRAAWAECQRLRRDLETSREKLSKLEAEQAYNEAQFKELDAAALRNGELEELEEEQKALANAEEIKESLSGAEACFSPDESLGIKSISSALKEAERQLEHVSKYLSGMDELCSRINSARIDIEDICTEIEAANSRIAVSGERLSEVEERLSLLYSLMSKHACRDISGLLEAKERFSEALFDSGALQEKMAKLEEELDKALERHAKLCSQLHEMREKAAPELAAEILSSLRFLELDRSVFSVELLPCPAGASGSEGVVFKFSSNGTDPVEVAKCASGGEISRIMLSLKAVMAKFAGMPTLIFDEIDSGVSGSTADKMGSMICEMGSHMQVFSITHLPQVAAKGKAHFLVSKKFDEVSRRAHTGIAKIEGEKRVEEIARMLSGSTITPEAIANARALLDR